MEAVAATMTEVQMPLAIRVASGHSVLAELASKEMAPFRCPECSKEVCLKKGEILRPHFAHLPPASSAASSSSSSAANASLCVWSPETVEHRLAKHHMAKTYDRWTFQRLCKQCRLPDASEKFSYVHQHITNTNGFEEYVIPGTQYRVDVAIRPFDDETKRYKGCTGVVEILQTHATPTAKEAYLRSAFPDGKVHEVRAVDVLKGILTNNFKIVDRFLSKHPCHRCMMRAQLPDPTIAISHPPARSSAAASSSSAAAAGIDYSDVSVDASDSAIYHNRLNREMDRSLTTDAWCEKYAEELRERANDKPLRSKKRKQVQFEESPVASEVNVSCSPDSKAARQSRRPTAMMVRRDKELCDDQPEEEVSDEDPEDVDLMAYLRSDSYTPYRTLPLQIRTFVVDPLTMWQIQLSLINNFHQLAESTNLTLKPLHGPVRTEKWEEAHQYFVNERMPKHLARLHKDLLRFTPLPAALMPTVMEYWIGTATDARKILERLFERSIFCDIDWDRRLAPIKRPRHPFRKQSTRTK